MPDQRAPGKSLVGCHVDDAFAAEIDRARGRKSRSDFLREALYDLLKKHNVTLPPAVKYAPDRAGKGGPRKKVVAMPEATMETAKVAEGGDPLPHNDPDKTVNYPKPKAPPKKKTKG